MSLRQWFPLVILVLLVLFGISWFSLFLLLPVSQHYICCCVSLRQWRGWCTPTLSPVSPDTIQSPLSTPLSLVPTPLVGVCACVFGAKRFGSIILCCPRPRPQSSEGLLDCSEAAAATPPHTGSPLHPATLTPHTSHLHTLPGQWDTSRRCV